MHWEHECLMNNEDPDQVNIMNCDFAKDPQVCLNITLEKHEEGLKEASRRARMEVINNLDNESRENLKNKELQLYTRQKKVPQVPPTDPTLPQQKIPPPPVSRLLPNPTFPKNDNVDFNFDLESILENINVTIPLIEISKIHSMKRRFEKLFKVHNEPVDPHIMLQ